MGTNTHTVEIIIWNFSLSEAQFVTGRGIITQSLCRIVYFKRISTTPYSFSSDCRNVETIGIFSLKLCQTCFLNCRKSILSQIFNMSERKLTKHICDEELT